MSWSKSAVRALALASLLALSAGCTVQPLYKSDGAAARDLKSPTLPGLAAAKGRIGISAADTRTAQIVRNRLIFALNGGLEPRSPLLYEVRQTVSGGETVVSIQSGSGVPAASLYRVTVAYQVVRLSDSAVIDKGSRFASTPFDRTNQLYAASRALLDARETAGKEAAERVALSVATAIAKDLRGGV
ncbi:MULTISPECIES: hypothetical protein [unclassified Aureimonas]|uniref:hypothetical protein n=1 Tax=unclassified Aureimonas TaxID=2615206 RepID=UPI0006F601AA|nr:MULTISPECIES: hypothetical protein [unclassified Aureimonas]KQT52603.1 hypothetical protein ASG62_15490 [Aureimonas sp. Leaf427]KQT77497.1 hypothetical protein ASG54_10920 [Aureimonas sp. Leaf460]